MQVLSSVLAEIDTNQTPANIRGLVGGTDPLAAMRQGLFGIKKASASGAVDSLSLTRLNDILEGLF